MGSLEVALYGEWRAKQRRHHGRSSKPGFQPAWRFTPNVRAWVEENLSTLDEMAPRPVLNVCCGMSRLGDVRLDVLPLGNVRGSAFALPFRDGEFGTVLCDAPWSMAYHVRHHLNRELVRVTRSGGALVWVGSWMPDPAWQIEELTVSSKASGWPSDALLLVRGCKP